MSKVMMSKCEVVFCLLACYMYSASLIFPITMPTLSLVIDENAIIAIIAHSWWTEVASCCLPSVVSGPLKWTLLLQLRNSMVGLEEEKAYLSQKCQIEMESRQESEGEWRSVNNACYLLNNARYLLNNARYLLNNACYLLNNTCYLLNITCYLLNNARYLLNNARYLLNNACYLLNNARYLLNNARYLLCTWCVMHRACLCVHRLSRHCTLACVQSVCLQCTSSVSVQSLCLQCTPSVCTALVPSAYPPCVCTERVASLTGELEEARVPTVRILPACVQSVWRA